MSISIEALKVKLDSLLQTISLHLADKLGRTEAAVSADRLTTPFTLALTDDATATASVNGAGPVNLSVVLKTVMSNPGTHIKITVDAKGRVTGSSALLAADIPALDAGKTTTGVFAAARIPTLNQNTTGNAATATRLATARQIAISNDAIGSATFDGTANIDLAVTLKDSGVAAGNYGDSVTVPTLSVDAQGRVTLAQNTAIRSASITVSGIARLNNATNSVSETEAATPKAVKAAYDLAALALPMSQKAAASGVCELDAAGLVPVIRVPTLNQNTTGNAGSATKLSTARTLTVGGDMTGSVATDWSTNPGLNLVLSSTGVTAGTYPKVTVDAKGRVTAGSALAAGDIPSLDASKINAGVFGTARIPSLDITKITNLQSSLDTKLSLSGGVVVGETEFKLGIVGGYGSSAENGASWGGCIYGMGPSYNGTGSGLSYGIVGTYGLHWLRSGHPDAIADVGEGLYITQAGVLKGGIGENGIWTIGDVSGFSDIRLKKDIVVIPNALDKVCSLRGVTYTRTDTGKTSSGVIAQEVREVLPEVIGTTPDGILTVANGNMVGLLVESIKELRKELMDIRAELAVINETKSGK